MKEEEMQELEQDTELAHLEAIAADSLSNAIVALRELAGAYSKRSVCWYGVDLWGTRLSGFVHYEFLTYEDEDGVEHHNKEVIEIS